jgi:predicted alpha/beta superfamily hydrolase
MGKTVGRTMGKAVLCVLSALLLAASVPCAAAPAELPPASVLGIGETFVIDSAILHEKRRINVAIPRGTNGQALPVLYMPDGGMDEDFLHVAGLLQVGAGNGTTRPFLLVGIENTERRRDLTGPTDVAKDRAIAPRVGGSAAFRRFIREELMPEVARRYRITGEKAIVGESLAGLFVMETLALAPDMFDSYIAIDPSLWWNGGALARQLDGTAMRYAPAKTLAVATSSDASMLIDGIDLAARLSRVPGLRFTYRAWPEETHATIYHPAALAAFRVVFKPVSASH